MEAVTHHLYVPDCTPCCPRYQQMQAYRDGQKNSEMLKVVAIWLVGLEFLFVLLRIFINLKKQEIKRSVPVILVSKI